eukprot:CAMPEP_0203651942 /NCGR_PEP_ID=MMETSP0088-20131115/28838_1 /ASSEMBLY_ACC=CAM_ASM_001087 /TAXON_ID=426623 /ORGANISM="Chaetoceros affinis, Strain CCMP159" /LENGTH=48 /DNA_ID= /DNA_START= /DNA_END= /DNA_ORIENTATION=
MKGASTAEKWERILRSSVAPRLSELETNMYLYPAARRLSRLPDPTSAA